MTMLPLLGLNAASRLPKRAAIHTMCVCLPPPVLLEPPTSNAFVQLATLTLETAATLYWYNNDPGPNRSAVYAYGYKLNL